MKRLFLVLLSTILFFLNGQARIIYLNVAEHDTWKTKTTFWVHVWKSSDTSDTKSIFMNKLGTVQDYVYWVNVDEGYDRIIFVATNSTSDWSVKTGDLEIRSYDDCYFAKSSGTPAWGTQAIYMKHPWRTGEDEAWVWKQMSPTGSSDTNYTGLYAILDFYGGEGKGCNWNTSGSSGDSKKEWQGSPSLVGSPVQGDLCMFDLNPSTGAVTITKATSFYLKSNWAGGDWEWSEAMTDNGDGTYSIVVRWGGSGCNWSSRPEDLGSKWVDYASITGSSDVEVGSCCIITLDPVAGTLSVTEGGHQIVDDETMKLYFTCGYDRYKNYYWGEAYEQESRVYAYMWNSSTGNIKTAWPGEEMKGCEENEYGQWVYMIPYDSNYDRIIFNNNSGTQYAGGYVKDGTTYTIGSQQTIDITLSGAPTAWFILDWDSNYTPWRSTVETWNPKRAAEDPKDASKHYYICKNCDRYVHDDHDYSEGCLKCSRLDLDPTSVPTRLATTFNLGTYDKVNLKRTFAAASDAGYGGYGTLSLPFAVSSACFNKAFGDEAYVAAYAGVEEGDRGYEFSFSNGTEMAANTPYIIYTPSGKTNPVFENVTVVSPTAYEVNPTAPFSMHSNFTPGFSMNGKYGVAYNRVIMRGSSTATINAYGAYLTFNRSGSASIAGIRTVSADEVETNTIREVARLIEQVMVDEAVYEQIGKKVEKVLR